VCDAKQLKTDSQPILDELHELVARARAGDLEILPRLRAVLDEHAEVWQCGDIALIARDSWIALIAGQDLALKELLMRKAGALRAEVAGPDPSPLERLLVDRIVACWLQAHHADAMVAQAGGVSIRQAEFAGKRQDAAHRRYLTAIGALATTRKLLPAGIEARGVARPSQPSLGRSSGAETSPEVAAARDVPIAGEAATVLPFSKNCADEAAQRSSAKSKRSGARSGCTATSLHQRR
jgi:hypothetical protein